MSYDLVVFDPGVAPREKPAFLSWYERQTEWDEPHDYRDPASTTTKLRGWLLEMIQAFPAMNGPLAAPDFPANESTLTDYSIGSSLIYASFAWSLEREAHQLSFRVAEQHGVGFFAVSLSETELWLPDAGGTLQLEP